MDQRVGITEDTKAQSVAQDLKSQGSRTGGPKFRVSKFQVMGYGLLLIAGLVAPLVGYPVFLMQALCFALFACAFNLLLGYTGLLSFGHAAFFSTAA